VLKDLRERRQLSQAVVARRAGVSPGYIGLIETGERGDRVSLDIVKRFGQALDANVEEMELLLKAAGHLGADEQLVPDGRPTFDQFVDADPRLTRTQKDILKAMYHSWLGSSARPRRDGVR
jgi:transcriptional regulator with XRE-family HTH domain